MDLNRKQFTGECGGKKVTLEISNLAGQANAAVLGTYGDTSVLATVVMGHKDKEGDYFPLMVNFEERFYAAGRILGSRFVRREGKSSDDAILTGRLIDRTIRPLFSQAMRREVQVVVTTLSVDGNNDPDFIGLLAASTALGISSVPWDGPVAGIRMVKIKNEPAFLINPDNASLEGKAIDFDAFVSGTGDLINMIELGGDEADETDVVNGFAEAQKEIGKLVTLQKKIIKEIGKEKEAVRLARPDKEVTGLVRNFLKDKLEAAAYVADKSEMNRNIAGLKEKAAALLKEKGREGDIPAIDAIVDEAINDLIHEKILKEGKRPAGRALDQVRSLHAEVALFKRGHGSAVFVRGNTQSLAMTTLGAPGDQQLVETIGFSGKRRFLLHYNFPPYSVGETGPFRGPGRREIGHGALAEKALLPLLPPQEQFPYTIRLVSEILSSNGSSSMATVCAGSLSLMDAGVPIRKPAAGIAMGLMMNEDGSAYKVLTDIQGHEDHHGDMDFKAAGTDTGVTAIQMDVKVSGITSEMLAATLAQAKQARLHILKTIVTTLAEPRKELSPYAPCIISYAINPELIGDVIGPGGKIINGIIDETGVTSIDIEDDGKVFITAPSSEKAQQALEHIKSITKEYSIGDIVEGEVIKILEFGAIVDLGGGRDGMIHVSELKEGFVKKVEDVVKVGDFLQAKIIKLENGRIGLSLKAMQDRQP